MTDHRRYSTSRLLRLLAALLILAAAAVLLRGYVTDDTFIHLRYSQHLLERAEFSFNPGQNSYGATSPLWVLGLALLLALGLAPLTAVWVLGFASAVAVLLLMDALLARLSWPPGPKLALLILTAADAWFLRWGLSGMETPLATAALLLLLWPAVTPSRAIRPARFWLAWGVAAGLAGLIRPEFFLLGPAALPWLLWSCRSERAVFAGAGHGGAGGGAESGAQGALPGAARDLLAAACGWLLAVGPWLVYAFVSFGRWTPETAAAKSYALSFSLPQLIASIVRSAGQLAATQGVIWLAVGTVALLALSFRRGPGFGKAARAPEPASSARPGRRTGRWPEGTALVGIAATWTAILVGGYALKQVWVISRYLAPLAPPLLLALATVAIWALGRLPAASRRRRLGVAALILGCLASLTVNGWLLVAKVRPHARSLSRGLHECYLRTGEWLNRNSDPGAVVAALDIGAIGYASNRRVLDLMGLVSPELLAMGHDLGFEEMVASGAWLEVTVPDYLVDRTDGPPRWVDRSTEGVRFELLRTCTIEGVGLTEAQPWTIALYRLEKVSPGQAPARGAGAPVSGCPAPCPCP